MNENKENWFGQNGTKDNRYPRCDCDRVYEYE
jgi:hypothetical protein